MKKTLFLKNIPAQDLSLFDMLGGLAEKMGVAVYAVGGYVRDRFLQRAAMEIDFVVIGEGPVFAKEAMKTLGGGGFVVYPKFGTASFLTGERKLEFVTARKETYRSDSRNPDVENSTLEEDLARRDFTVNAMAMDLSEARFGRVEDPFHGHGDLQKRIIRTPLDPVRTFSDDPLRIMRAARFSGQLGFHVDAKTLEAMFQERERLRIVSQERITDEILKILSQDKPSVGLRVLQGAGILEIVLPELSGLVGIEQRDSYHHKDVFEHTLKVIDNVAAISPNPYLRFAALVHDIGKPKVKRFAEGSGWTFHGHELVGVRLLRRMAGRMKLSKEYMRTGQKLTHLHMRPIQLIGEEVTDSAIRRLIVQAGEDLDDLMALCRADITSGNPQRVKKHLANFDSVTIRMKEVEEKDRLRAFQSPVRGDEIMTACGIKPGPRVGILKKAIEEAILEGKIPNDHDAAYQYLLRIKDEEPNASIRPVGKRRGA